MQLNFDDEILFGKKKKRRDYVNPEHIKKAFGYKCRICNRPEEKVGKLLMAHLKAHSKGGKVRIPLCGTCHIKYDGVCYQIGNLKNRIDEERIL